MKSSKEILKYCASICEGDGVSPRLEKTAQQFSKQNNQRLCRQAQKWIHYSIQELGLHQWTVQRVKMSDNRAAFIIELVPLQPVNLSEVQQVHRWLQSNQGQIRSVVAEGLHRKSVPSFNFQILMEDEDYE